MESMQRLRVMPRGRESRSYLNNEDYDGDEVMHTVATDEWLESQFYPFSPFFNLTKLVRPYEISGNLSMTEPVVASISDWIESQRYPNGNHVA